MNISAQLLGAVGKPALVHGRPAEMVGNQEGEGGANSAPNFANLIQERAAAERQPASKIDTPENGELSVAAPMDADLIPANLQGLEKPFSQPAYLGDVLTSGGAMSNGAMSNIVATKDLVADVVDPEGLPVSDDEMIQAEKLVETAAITPGEALAQTTSPTLELQNAQSPAAQANAAAIQSSGNAQSNGVSPNVTTPQATTPVASVQAGAASATTSAVTSPIASAATLANEPPRMFRTLPTDAAAKTADNTGQTVKQDGSLNANSIEARNARVLDIFANKSANGATFANPQNAALSANSALTNGAAKAAVDAVNNPLTGLTSNSNVVLSNPVITPGTQVPVIPLATIGGLSSHLLMQVHPAVTQRNNPVENSLLSNAAQRSNKSIELQLVPRALGVIDMKIVNQGGQIRIVVETQTVEAQRLIQAEARSMLETFRNAGLKLEEFTVTQNSRLEANAQNERQALGNGNTGDQQYQQTNPDRHDGREQSAFSIDAAFAGEDAAMNNSAETELAREGLYL